MNRDVIKLVAMFTMLLNHMAAVFLEPGQLLYEVLTDIGYFTAITMCYFLVEGYEYTRSRKKYGGRLLFFALLSQIPYSLALSEDGSITSSNLNMMFTLFFCFLIICVQKQITESGLRRNITIVLVLCTIFCDWALFAAVFTLLFLWAGDSINGKKRAYITATACFGIYMFLSGIGRFSPMVNILYALGGAAGPALSGCCNIYLYNGKRMEHGRGFLKWFFYLFYPCHLLVLGMIRFYV